jgi:ADP-heptose:LPS heptosyltransferase
MICVHACPANRNANERRWNIGHWAALLRPINEDISFIGSRHDWMFYRALSLLLWEKEGLHNTAGALQLVDVARLLKKSRMIVCVNSGIMHMAVALNVPVVAIVGGTPASIILPADNSRVRWVEDPELRWWNPEDGHVARTSRINEILPEQVRKVMDEMVG